MYKCLVIAMLQEFLTKYVILFVVFNHPSEMVLDFIRQFYFKNAIMSKHTNSLRKNKHSGNIESHKWLD